jgi:hypothetical protein
LLGRGLKGIDRNRRASKSLSPTLTLFASPYGKLYLKMQLVIAQAVINKTSFVIPSWGPDPKKPKQRIPPTEWPTVVGRITENHESLRTIAHDYEVSHETVRCIFLASRNKDGG